jgi:hypothetical protein
MTCIEFNLVVIDLGRERPLDSGMRQEALEHAARCPQCARRLEAERSLVAAFRLWAEADSGKLAPEQIEAKLRGAFSAIRDRQAWVRRTALWVAGVAAAVLLAVAGTKLLKRSAPAPPPPQTHRAVPDQTNPAQHQRPEFAMQKTPPAPAARRADRGPKPARQTATPMTTEFLPLPYADDSAPLGDGQVVRVEMQGSALAQIGVPLEPDAARQRITADILLDEYGTARAIRFVSTSAAPLH